MPDARRPFEADIEATLSIEREPFAIVVLPRKGLSIQSKKVGFDCDIDPFDTCRSSQELALNKASAVHQDCESKPILANLKRREPAELWVVGLPVIPAQKAGFRRHGGLPCKEQGGAKRISGDQVDGSCPIRPRPTSLFLRWG